MKDRREFQNGSLGERISLLTSLLRWSFLDRSARLLLPAPITYKVLKIANGKLKKVLGKLRIRFYKKKDKT